MADKIKLFFQKKKASGKFKHAGKGYKLTESSKTPTPTNDVREPVERVEPTEEAKIAGQAALARLEAKKPDITKFNTSYAAIQARVKKELELERKARQKLETADVKPSDSDTKSQVKDPALLGVVDVYFRCPYMSAEILTHQEWKKKIKDFLYEQLEGEEAGLTACLIIQNCNQGREKVQNCVETLGKYVENILNNPDVEKYRKIRMSNKIFQEKVLPIDGAVEFLKAAGFEKKVLLNNDQEEDFLVWNPENCNIEDLNMLVEALKSAEPIPLELDRNLQVLLPHQAAIRNELPPTFFTISLEELKREQQLRTEAIERSQMLRTKAMREKDEQRELRRYKYALLRIRFPDNIILQGTFSVHEKFQAVVDFVRENLIDREAPFVLEIPTGQKLTQEAFEKTLFDLKLMPAVLLIFAWATDKKKSETQPKGYLREDILCYIQEM